MLLVLGAYFIRLDHLPLRGEESRRAQVAVEMINTGDWLVPRQQGEVFASRPPLQNWVIALVGLARGSVDVAAVRLPSVAAVLLSVLLVYGYSRTFLSRLGALAAAAALATMGQVLELGRLGETEALFMLMVSGSLLVWHWGYVRGWPPAWTWSTAYLLVALGTLTKGFQAPVYFAVAVGGFLLWTRRGRDALTWPHLLGILLFLAVWAAWQVPYYLTVGAEGAKRIYVSDVALRFDDSRWITFLKHLVSYPAELLCGCLLPWSVFLLAYLNRGFRRTTGAARGHVLFLACALGAALATLWPVPGAKTRYLMPLYPCVAPLIGLVVDRCWQAERAVDWSRLWYWFATVMAPLMIAAGVAIAAATWLDAGSLPLGQPGWFAIVYLLAAAGMAALTLRSRGAAGRWPRLAGLLAVAGFLALTYNGAVTNVLVRASNRETAAAVAELKQQLPRDARLVSLGEIDHLFAYYFGEPIPLVAWPAQGAQPSRDLTYFCYSTDRLPPVKVDFPWEPVAAISCDRTSRAEPQRVVIVGHRLPLAQARADGHAQGVTR